MDGHFYGQRSSHHAHRPSSRPSHRASQPSNLTFGPTDAGQRNPNFYIEKIGLPLNRPPPSYAESVVSEDPYLQPVKLQQSKDEDPYLKPMKTKGSFHGYASLPDPLHNDLKKPSKESPGTAEDFDNKTVYDEVYADINDNDIYSKVREGVTIPPRENETHRSRNKRCVIICVVVVILIVIAGAGGAVYALTGKKSGPDDTQTLVTERNVGSTTVTSSFPPTTEACVIPCSGGRYSLDCCECSCSNMKIGTATYGDPTAPLFGVQLRLASCGALLYTTGVDGSFYVSGVCDEAHLTISKPGYIPIDVAYGELGTTVHLQRQVPLEMKLHPMSQAVAIGSDVTLTCRAEGNPAPNQYQWYKNGVAIEGGTGTELTLESIDNSHEAHYACAADAPPNVLFSESAFIRAIDTGSGRTGCEDSPVENKIILPGDCTYQGSSTMDLGRCSATSCFADTGSGYCCAPTGMASKVIQCGTESHVVQTVAQCGCAPCSHTVDIVGTVGAVNGIHKMTYGTVYIGSDSVAGTGRDAIFGLSAPVTNARNKLIIHNENLNSQDFYENTTHVMHIPHTNVKTFETTVDVRLNDRSQSITGSGNNGAVISLTFSSTSVRLGDIFIPRNAVVDSDGSVVSLFEIYYTVIEPQNYPQMRAVPADFTALDDHGHDSFLFTYGLFTLEVRNKDDENTPIAEVQSDFTFSISRTAQHFLQLTDMSNIFLWKLNTVSGYWEKVGRFSQTVSIPGLSIYDNPAWFSIGRINTDLCHSKVRAFNNEQLNEANQLQGAEIVYYVRDSNDSAMISRMRAHSDQGDHNGYCIKHPCNSQDLQIEIYGYVYGGVIRGHGISSDSLESSLHVASGDNNQLLTTVDDLSQPFYPADAHSTYSSETCSTADFSDAHFILVANEYIYSIDAVQEPDSIGQNCDPNLHKLWHGVDQHTQHDYKACYIKIHVTGATRPTRIQVASKVGTFQHGSNINPGDLYGIREDRIEDGFACIEYRPPGPVGCNSNQTTDTDQSQIDISVVDPQTVYNVTLDASFSFYYQDYTIFQGESKLSVKLDNHVNGPTVGLYCEENSNKYFAKREAKDACLQGPLDQADPGFAVKFTES